MKNKKWIIAGIIAIIVIVLLWIFLSKKEKGVITDNGNGVILDNGNGNGVIPDNGYVIPEYFDTTLDLKVSPFPNALPNEEYTIIAILKDSSGIELIDKPISLDIRDGAGNLIFHKTITSGASNGTIMLSPFPATHRIMISFKDKEDWYKPSEDSTVLGIACQLGYYWSKGNCMRLGDRGGGGGLPPRDRPRFI